MVTYNMCNDVHLSLHLSIPLASVAERWYYVDCLYVITWMGDAIVILEVEVVLWFSWHIIVVDLQREHVSTQDLILDIQSLVGQ
jgi:hypothetical protein